MENTPAAEAGIRRGDVIVAVNNRTIKTAEELQTLVDSSGLDSNLKFKIVRGDRDMILSVKTTQLNDFS